ncbi:Highly reducing polyketide synthase gloL, partial [Frankliniella fusca]
AVGVNGRGSGVAVAVGVHSRGGSGVGGHGGGGGGVGGHSGGGGSVGGHGGGGDDRGGLSHNLGSAHLDLADVGGLDGNVDGHLLDVELGLDVRHLGGDGLHGAAGGQDALLEHGVQGGGEGAQVGLDDGGAVAGDHGLGGVVHLLAEGGALGVADGRAGLHHGGGLDGHGGGHGGGSGVGVDGGGVGGVSGDRGVGHQAGGSGRGDGNGREQHHQLVHSCGLCCPLCGSEEVC